MNIYHHQWLKTKRSVKSSNKKERLKELTYLIWKYKLVKLFKMPWVTTMDKIKEYRHSLKSTRSSKSQWEKINPHIWFMSTSGVKKLYLPICIKNWWMIFKKSLKLQFLLSQPGILIRDGSSKTKPKLDHSQELWLTFTNSFWTNSSCQEVLSHQGPELSLMVLPSPELPSIRPINTSSKKESQPLRVHTKNWLLGKFKLISKRNRLTMSLKRERKNDSTASWFILFNLQCYPISFIIFTLTVPLK